MFVREVENNSALRLVHDNFVLVGNRQRLFFIHLSLQSAYMLEKAGLQVTLRREPKQA